ncbi:MAG: HAD family phosphatase [Candidatus Woesearchaeota archaeon]
MIKAVIFDMDGVMIDNQPYQKKAWSQLFAEEGLKISDEELSKKIRGRPTLVGLREYFSGKYGEDYIQRLARRKEEIYKDIFEKEFKIVRGLVEFVKNLHQSRLKIGIATSSTKDLFDFSMKKMGIADYFDVIVTSDQITHPKPHPETYLITADELRIVPNQCLVFEDSVAGIESARAAGMKVILVMTSHTTKEVGPVNGAINNFTEIKASDILQI